MRILKKYFFSKYSLYKKQLFLMLLRVLCGSVFNKFWNSFKKIRFSHLIYRSQKEKKFSIKKVKLMREGIEWYITSNEEHNWS